MRLHRFPAAYDTGVAGIVYVFYRFKRVCRLAMEKIEIGRLIPSDNHYVYHQLNTFFGMQKTLGYSYTDLSAAPPHVWISDRGIDDFDALLTSVRQFGLQVHLLTADYQSNRYLLNTPDPARLEKSMRYYKNCMIAADGLGAKMLAVSLCGAVRDESLSNAISRGISSVRHLCAMAEQYNLLIGIDPPFRMESPVFYSCESMRLLVKEVSHPLLRINLNTALIHDNNETISLWFEALREKISFVRMSDARMGKAQYPWGDGVLSIERCISDLERCGYDGALGLRFTSGGCEQDPKKADERCYATIKNYLRIGTEI